MCENEFRATQSSNDFCILPDFHLFYCSSQGRQGGAFREVGRRRCMHAMTPRLRAAPPPQSTPVSHAAHAHQQARWHTEKHITQSTTHTHPELNNVPAAKVPTWLVRPREPQVVNVGRVVAAAVWREGGPMATKDRAVETMAQSVSKRRVAMIRCEGAV